MLFDWSEVVLSRNEFGMKVAVRKVASEIAYKLRFHDLENHDALIVTIQCMPNINEDLYTYDIIVALAHKDEFIPFLLIKFTLNGRWLETNNEGHFRCYITWNGNYYTESWKRDDESNTNEEHKQSESFSKQDEQTDTLSRTFDEIDKSVAELKKTITALSSTSSGKFKVALDYTIESDNTGGIKDE